MDKEGYNGYMSIIGSAQRFSPVFLQESARLEGVKEQLPVFG
jgi:hypothetical protein